MPLPPLLNLPDEAAYRAHFEREYVHGPAVVTPDDITVRFFPERFDHAFYKSSCRGAQDKAVFDTDRAARMDWIRAVLTDASLERYRDPRRPKEFWCVVLEATTPYIVVVKLYKNNPPLARFITAFVVDDSWGYLIKMRRMPRWQRP
jgi:hypothetical protein